MEKSDLRPTKKRKAKQRVAILSRQRTLYTTTRLIEAVDDAGCQPVVVDALRCSLTVGGDGLEIFHRGARLEKISSVIPRVGASITTYGLNVVTHFESMGIYVPNPARSIAVSRDKLRCLQLLAASGLAVPKTVMAQKGSHVKRMVEWVGGLPVIIKLLRGTQGVGVMIASTMAEARTIVETFWDLKQDILIQEFVAEAKGSDVRALVVGDRVVGAMKRTAKEGEFRSNLHRGGQASPVVLHDSVAQVAIRAARAVGLEIAGVDLLESTRGPKVMELNSSPGFEGLEKATGNDIAAEIIAHVLRRSEATIRDES